MDLLIDTENISVRISLSFQMSFDFAVLLKVATFQVKDLLEVISMLAELQLLNSFHYYY